MNYENYATCVGNAYGEISVRQQCKEEHRRKQRIYLLIQNKKNHKRRNRKRYHIYLSRFFVKFKATSTAQQVALINSVRYNEGEDEDTRSIDSTNTPSNEAIKPWEIIKLAYSRWSKLDVSVRDSQQRRADILNLHPIPGKFTKIPDNISEYVEDLTLHSLTNEWRSITGKI